MNSIKLIIGLGNPGKKYDGTRHNVGFACINILRQLFDFDDFVAERKWQSLLTHGTYEKDKVVLVKPQTFMNASGSTVSQIMAFYKCAPQDLWLIYDDIDLPLGVIRIRKSGSAGTHNGMKSVIAALGFKNFPRVRIGIENRGVSAATEQDITSFVLHKFLREEEAIIQNAIIRAAKAVKISITEGIEAGSQYFPI